MAFLDGLAVRFEDLPSPIATASDTVDVIAGQQISFSQSLPASTPPSISDLVDVIAGQQPRGASYDNGYEDGELYGFSSPREKTMPPIAPGETDADKRTISFHLYGITGLPASGILGEAPVCAPTGSQIQTNRDLAGFVNATGTFSHMGDAVYRYTFAPSEIASLSGEGNIWLRIKVSNFRTAIFRIPLRAADPTPNEIRDALLNAARSGFVTIGTVGEGVAIGVALLQGNFFMDQVTNTEDGQTQCRIRCFHTGAATAAATAGGVGQGEFITLLVTTSYSAENKIVTHRVVQQ